MTNVLQETRGGRELAAVRPGLTEISSPTGNGNGLVSFNNVLISVYGDTVYQGSNVTVTAENFGTQELAEGRMLGSDGDVCYLQLGTLSSSFEIYTTNGTTLDYLGEADPAGGDPFVSVGPSEYYDPETGFWYVFGSYDDGIDYFAATCKSSDAITYTVTLANASYPLYEPGEGSPVFTIGSNIYNILNITLGSIDLGKTTNGGVSWVDGGSHVIPDPQGSDVSLIVKQDNTVYIFYPKSGGGTVLLRTSNGDSFSDITLPFSEIILGFVFAYGRYYFRTYDATDIYTYYSETLSTNISDYELISTVPLSDNADANIGGLGFLPSGNIMVGPYTGSGTYPDYPIEAEIFSFVPPSSGTVTDSFFDFVESTT